MLDLASHVSHIVFTESGSFVVARIRDEINTYMCITREKNSVRYQRENLSEFRPDSTLLSRNLPKDPEIAEFAEFMKQYPSTTAVIEGHTSAPGSEAYNMDLSKRRAANFKEVMVDMYGIEGSRLETIGYGETQLLDNGKNAEAHRVNRRISVTVKDTVKVAEEK